MFNDLTDNNQKTSEVDDIFAETDKAPTPSSGSQIETRQVGLSSLSEKPMDEDGLESDNRDEQVKTGKFLKIAIIFVVFAIIILGGYLLYTKFLAVDKTEVSNLATEVDETNKEAAEAEALLDDEKKGTEEKKAGDDGFVTPIVEQEDQGNLDADGNNNSNLNNNNNNSGEAQPLDSDGDGISDFDEITIYKTNPNLIDTDFDGLTDYDEIFKYKTDPLKSDTDGDGLSDYQEVITYKTDPLVKDTDGDGYSDYEEVMNGYNPLGDGVLPGF